MDSDRAPGVLPQGAAVALDSFHQEGTQETEVLAHIIVNVPACLKVLPKTHLHMRGDLLLAITLQQFPPKTCPEHP